MGNTIAIVGSGISGLVCARLLSRNHDITVFEADDRIGGHTHTHDIEYRDEHIAVDSGFIVHNRRTYPSFVRLMEQLGVETDASDMSFSVRCDRTGVEWGGPDPGKLLARKRNLLQPDFYRMFADALRFRLRSPEVLELADDTLSLGEYLEREGYSQAFVRWFVVPMGAAIWSANPRTFLDFPARTFVTFFENHGFLHASGPRWRVIRGGSKQYLEPLTRPFADRIRTGAAVTALERDTSGVTVVSADGGRERFDRVVLACHSDQALRILGDGASAREREVLGAIRYQANDTVLHTDESVLPRTRRVWSAWNYLVPREVGDAVAITYNMNILQNLRDSRGRELDRQYCVTLNRTSDIDPASIVQRMTYHHPVYEAGVVAAQRRWAEIDGARGTHFCGAYWFYGFHEDGVKSGLRVAEKFGEVLG